MSKLPLIEGVLKYVNEKNINFTMPGHKRGEGFFATIEGREFIDKLIYFDITEVNGVDNLHKAEGIIKESEDLLASLYGSKKSYFLVNGSTSGNMIMIFSSFEEGDKVIVDRNCHRSIFNGIIMRKLRPIFVENIIDTEVNAPFSVDMEHFFQCLQQNKDAKGIIITYPNYYGVCCPLEAIIKEAKDNNMKILIDSAHGAHFGINSKLPKSAVNLGADMVVVSSHKTLPSFTQTAFLHVNREEDIEKVDFYFSSFSSTSPSYLFLCSMDYARYYLSEFGEESYSRLLEIIEKYRAKINEIKGIRILDESYVRKRYKNYNLDTSRYIINLEKGYNSNLFLDYLRENKIQCEMSDTFNVVLIFSPFNKEEEFEYLYKVLMECNLERFKGDNVDLIKYTSPKGAISPHEALNMKKKKIKLWQGEGQICGENITPYPPGVPLIMMGEVIDKEVINMIKYYKKQGLDIIGLHEDEIIVITNN
ncbi:aminotransferase class V-fold PLP-dependent enzyme [Clostridium malenominatum]|uniref:Aminotransferase class V-fold PLP-dependent enzyme n=1 Tax=Clostridium malenominatum TaxID=1539 RepID=A0ABP3UAX7_9CLOT